MLLVAVVLLTVGDDNDLFKVLFPRTSLPVSTIDIGRGEDRPLIDGVLSLLSIDGLVSSHGCLPNWLLPTEGVHVNVPGLDNVFIFDDGVDIIAVMVVGAAVAIEKGCVNGVSGVDAVAMFIPVEVNGTFDAPEGKKLLALLAGVAVMVGIKLVDAPGVLDGKRPAALPIVPPVVAAEIKEGMALDVDVMGVVDGNRFEPVEGNILLAVVEDVDGNILAVVFVIDGNMALVGVAVVVRGLLAEIFENRGFEPADPKILPLLALVAGGLDMLKTLPAGFAKRDDVVPKDGG